VCPPAVPLPPRLQIGQLLTIFQVLGTPCKDEWPGVDALPDWMEGFPSWRARDLAEVQHCL
jgi:hypothetical protein